MQLVEVIQSLARMRASMEIVINHEASVQKLLNADDAKCNNDVKVNVNINQTNATDSNKCVSMSKQFVTTIALLVKWVLTVIYKIGTWNNVSWITFCIVGLFFSRGYINQKKYKLLRCCGDCVNIFLTPLLLMCILRTYYFDSIYSNTNDNSWEIGLCVWWFAIGLYHIFAYIVPCFKYYEKYNDYKTWWKKIRKDREKIKTLILIPLGINFKTINTVNSVWMDWHIVLVGLLPAIFVWFTLNFVFEKTVTLQCGNRYSDDANEKIAGEYCIWRSSWDQWYIKYFTDAFSGTVSAWAAIKVLTTFILKYGNETKKCQHFCGIKEQFIGGRVDILNEIDEIHKLKQAIKLLREQKYCNDQNLELDALLM